MDPSFDELSMYEFYTFGNTSCHAKVLYSKHFKKHYIWLIKQSRFITNEGEEKSTKSFVLYTIAAVEQLAVQLEEILKNAKEHAGKILYMLY